MNINQCYIEPDNIHYSALIQEIQTTLETLVAHPRARLTEGVRYY